MKKTPPKNKEVAQVGRFGLVGISNTLVDFILLNLLVMTILPKNLEIINTTILGINVVVTGVIVAGIISGTAAMINSYIFNMRFTFRKKNVNTRHTVYFFLITIFGLYFIRPIILKIFTDTWVWPADVAYYITSSLKLPLSREFDERNLALMIAVLIVLVYNYLMYKKFVFNDEKK
ncbi:MAG TPA: GtrA family protein [Candidatus Saccharibacteria bacterium]|nr:GtrA family protein [Candidatus Saccharibacteria bacterium]HMT39650.1 GtrA family protein [Candidatus Saccharibacteria bacterium]